MTNDMNVKQKFRMRIISFALLLFSTLVIFAIAQAISALLKTYELSSMYVSFCAGFILFTPLVSLLLHPLVFVDKVSEERSQLSILMANFALVLVVQCLFFLIWITDAVVVYSIYVDQNSFLAKSFNIVSENQSNLSIEFYWANLFLAWFFALLSLVLGVMPCLIVRMNNQGVVNNFISSFAYAKQHKIPLAFAALCIAMAVVLPLLYMKFLFLLFFPMALTGIILYLSGSFMSYKIINKSMKI